jgi:hypothetical protein
MIYLAYCALKPTLQLRSQVLLPVPNNNPFNYYRDGQYDNINNNILKSNSVL